MSIIRLATVQDLPICAKAMKDLGPLACAPGHETVTLEALIIWMAGVLSTRSNYRLYVAERDGRVTAGCGGALETFNYPPHYLVVCEWAWWRDADEPRKTAAELWKTVCRWGKLNNAVLAGYAIAKTGRSAGSFTEIRKYKELTTWETSHSPAENNGQSPIRDYSPPNGRNSAPSPPSSQRT